MIVILIINKINTFKQNLQTNKPLYNMQYSIFQKEFASTLIQSIPECRKANRLLRKKIYKALQIQQKHKNSHKACQDKHMREIHNNNKIEKSTKKTQGISKSICKQSKISKKHQFLKIIEMAKDQQKFASECLQAWKSTQQIKRQRVEQLKKQKQQQKQQKYIKLSDESSGFQQQNSMELESSFLKQSNEHQELSSHLRNLMQFSNISRRNQQIRGNFQSQMSFNFIDSLYLS